MKLRDLRPYTRAAIAATLRRIEDRDTTSPTWDGRTLHLHRLKREDHVLHEVAHWIVAPPHYRGLPNYGCGTDPDKGGPLVDVLAGAGDLDTFGMTPLQVTIAIERDAEARHQVADLYERHASFVTVILMRRAGMPWLDAARRHWLKTDDTIACGWEVASVLHALGVDLEDPLRPFLGAR